MIQQYIQAIQYNHSLIPISPAHQMIVAKYGPIITSQLSIQITTDAADMSKFLPSLGAM